MKRYYILTVLLIITVSCLCQKKTENVIVTSGSTISSDGGTIDWIIGENLVDHQVLLGQKSPEEVFPELKEKMFTVFPTITSGFVTLVAREEKPENLYVTVYDLNNKLLSRRAWDQNPMDADLSEYDHGIYIINIELDDLTPLITFKIIRE